MNIAALERDLEKKQDEARSLFKKNAESAEAEKRETTDAERASVQTLLDEAKGIKTKIERAKSDDAMRAQIDGLVPQASREVPAGDRSRSENRLTVSQPRGPMKTLGQQFVESEAMTWLQETKGRRGTRWSSPSQELALISTDAGSPGSAGDFIVPDYRDRLVDLLFTKLTVADLMGQTTTTSTSITYMQEMTFTNSAASVAEAGLKPESNLIYERKTAAITKLAHWMQVTDEALEDVPRLRSLIDNRLRFGLQYEEEDQLLNGNAAGEDLVGLMNTTGMATTVVAGGSPGDSNADAVFKQMMALQHVSFVMPEGIVMHPTNWQSIALSKNADDQYYAGGPFNSPPITRLWGLPVVLTPRISVNTALVGAFRTQSEVIRKGGIRVEATNSHSDFFIYNKIVILAEERVGIVVYRPSAFGKVTLS